MCIAGAVTVTPFHPISGDRFDNSNAIAKAIGWAFFWLEILLQNFLIP